MTFLRKDVCVEEAFLGVFCCVVLLLCGNFNKNLQQYFCKGGC